MKIYFNCFAVAALIPFAQADKLDKALASAILKPSSNLCQGTGGSQTSFSTTYTSTFDVSQWDVNTNQYEEDVFEVDLSHTDDANPDQSWTIRIGKGGQISSMRVAVGEAIANQANPVAIWNDLVQQLVAVNLKLNSPTTPNFIHQAGPYAKDQGMPPPFYSPNLALDCSEDYCSTINWGQQAHVPTTFDSPLLYYTRYRNCGGGVIEYDMATYHFGLDTTDQYKYFNTPWTGIRTSTFRDMMISNPAGQLEHTFPMGGFGPNLRDLDTTGGFTTFAQDLELPSDDFDFGYCVNTTKVLPETADVPCTNVGQDVVPFVLEVFANNSAQENGLAATYGVKRTVSMRLCDLAAPVRTGKNGWGNPYDGVILTNDRSGFSFQSDYLIHPCWEDKKTYFSSSVSQDVLNEEFVVGDTISVKYVTSGKAVTDQHALTFVHGVNPEYPDTTMYRAKSRMRYGTTNNRRDGTVWTTNWQGKFRPTNTYLSRKYMITDKLGNMESTASALSGETFEDVENIAELNPGEAITLWGDANSFGASIGSESCSAPTATIACTGSSTPATGLQPLFYITCGETRAITHDPYFMSIIDVAGTKRPYECVDETATLNRPTWKLLGFFDSECPTIDSKSYAEALCDNVDTPSPVTPAPVTPAPVTPAPVTPAPVTPAPVTPAPVTPAPVTPAPVTPAPVTPAPVTPAPVTPAPVTPAPVTPAPVTPAPVTPAPVTPAPVTPAPVTPAPVTPAPVTPAPVTPAPITPAPVTPAPVTPAPITPAPITPAPVSGAPVTDSPVYECKDRDDWIFEEKGCNWVANRPYNPNNPNNGRCFRTGDDGILAKDACPVACSTCEGEAPSSDDDACKDDSDWVSDNNKGCAWIARLPYRPNNPTNGRCFRAGVDGRLAKDACPVACSACEGEAPSSDDDECTNDDNWTFGNKGCDWVANLPYSPNNPTKGRCFRAGDNGILAKDACLVACSVCGE